MAIRLPLEYAVDLSSDAARAGHLVIPGAPPIHGGAPIEFGGRDDWWSPEQLLLAAAGLCLMSTFRVFADRERLTIEAYRSRVEGTLNKTAEGLAFTSIRIQVDLVVPLEQATRSLAVFDRAKQHCIVTHSLRVPVDATVDVRAPDVAAASEARDGKGTDA